MYLGQGSHIWKGIFDSELYDLSPFRDFEFFSRDWPPPTTDHPPSATGPAPSADASRTLPILTYSISTSACGMSQPKSVAGVTAGGSNLPLRRTRGGTTRAPADPSRSETSFRPVGGQPAMSCPILCRTTRLAGVRTGVYRAPAVR